MHTIEKKTKRADLNRGTQVLRVEDKLNRTTHSKISCLAQITMETIFITESIV